jgi:serine/threonine protein kinase
LAIKFIRKLLDPNPRTRLSAKEAIRDPWITGFEEKPEICRYTAAKAV